MIQPNEVRVGNLFNPITRNTEVHLPATLVFIKIIEIKAFSVRVILKDMHPATLEDWVEKPIRDLSPIPLTPEILTESCGFEKGLESPIHKRKDFTLRPFGTISQIENEFQFFCNGRLIVLKYVHQLQNIYFVLMDGKELEIKALNKRLEPVIGYDIPLR